jgi:uncharacterized RDD family membrane protein YckC
VAYYITYVVAAINALQFVDVKLRNFVGFIITFLYAELFTYCTYFLAVSVRSVDCYCGRLGMMCVYRGRCAAI